MSAASDGRPTRYSSAQKWLHWLIALFVLGMVPVGLVMANMEDGEPKNRIYELHKSFGLVTGMLVLARIALRLAHGAPPVERDLPGWQRLAAKGTHVALYVLLVLVPLTGWIATSACCAPVQIFGIVPVTLPIGGGMEFGERVYPVHLALALTLAALAALHLGAALHHHLVRRDRTLRRMLPE